MTGTEIPADAMSRTNPPHPALALLVALGRLASAEGSEAHGLLSRLRPQSTINGQSPAYWHRVCARLDVEALAALARGAVLAERELNWRGGSVAAAIWVYRALESRDPVRAEREADWLLANTRNDYVPFGGRNGGARSLAEYHAWKAAFARASAAREARESARVVKDRERRELRDAQRGASAALRGTPERDELLRSLRELPALDALRQAIHDPVYAIETYPTWLASQARSPGLLEALTDDERRALYERLWGPRRGPWALLKQTLARRLGVAQWPVDGKPWPSGRGRRAPADTGSP